MKKIINILSLILIFVFLFSVTICAVSYAPLYTANREIYSSASICIEAALQSYRDNTGYDGQLYYIVISYVDKYEVDYCRARIYISDSPFVLNGIDDSQFIVSSSGDLRQRIVLCSDGISVSFTAYNDASQVSGTSITIAPGEDTRFICSSHTVTDAEGNIYLLGVEDSLGDSDDGFFFGAFEDFADFGEESSEHYNNAMNQTVTENENSPNDSVFLNILQAMVGSLTTNNSISQQISNQLQHFTEQFFNNFAQYSLGLMTDILNALNEFTGKFDMLLDIVNLLYDSGIGSNGEFGLDNMFSYLLVPSDDFVDAQYDKLVGALPFIEEIQGISDTLLNLFQTVEPKSPTITIHAGTYGFIVLTDDCVIDFEWFIDWKPYTDIFIAVFVYAGLALHLMRQLPGILGGTSSVVNSASGLDKPQRMQKGGKGS